MLHAFLIRASAITMVVNQVMPPPFVQATWASFSHGVQRSIL